jgi:polyphosphate glucokinase
VPVPPKQTRAAPKKPHDVLAIDIGGTRIKFRTQAQLEPVKFDSGPTMTPQRMLETIKELTHGWKYDRVAIGFPGPVANNAPLREPWNLGSGWKNFPFDQAFNRKPVRMINDAAMQALGGYDGGDMLFLGLGTGLGSAMVLDKIVHGMELAHMPWKKGKSYEDYLGAAGLAKSGRKAWTKNVFEVVEILREGLLGDYVVLGGGNAKLLKDLPAHTRMGSNKDAFIGGFRLWG